MKVLTLLIALVVSGCYQQKVWYEVHIMSDVAIKNICKKGKHFNGGCATPCQIYLPKNYSQQLLAHEIAHCVYGRYHP